MNYKVLIVEDEVDIAQVTAYNLRHAGYEVVHLKTGRDALKTAREQAVNLVLLDLMLPDISGIEVCKQFKKDAQLSTLPIMVLSAKGDEIDRVVAFELGVDDYIVKPFSVRELVLRVSAILRRKQTPAVPIHLIEVGCLKIDPSAHRVYVNGEEIELTALEFKLLVTIHERRGRVQSRETLLDTVWGITAEIHTRTVDTHVKRLREKLGEASGYIETVRGVGYRFSENIPSAPSTDSH